MQETRVQSLGLKDPLEKGMATHSSILVRRIPWTEEPDWLQSMGSQSDRMEQLTLLTNTEKSKRIRTALKRGSRMDKEAVVHIHHGILLSH